MDEDKLRWLAAIIIVAIGLAYMGWLVLTFMEQRETGITIRESLAEWLAANPGTAPKPPVDAQVID
jgi:hypothetical protein